MPVRRNRGRQGVVLPNKASEDQIKALHKYLDRIYFDDSAGGSFGTASKLVREVRRRGHYRNVGIGRIQNYLNKRDTYGLYKSTIDKFPTPPVFVTGINKQQDMDLMDVSRDAKENDGVKYIITSIDVLSKYGMMRTLKTKEAVEVAAAAATIFDERKPDVVQTDLGNCIRLYVAHLLYSYKP